MRSKTSFFNGTVYRKNLTRFAPVWVLYTLCLITGLLLTHSNGGGRADYWFAYHYPTLREILGLVNMGYALLVAQLLFGDLYSSRMCNALHAMPLRREGWFCTNILSGLTVSIVPTALMTLLALMMVSGSAFTNASEMVLRVFLAVNLQYICFFGIAVFSAMCVGTRFAMAAGYGLLNFGAYILYWLIDILYAPMLYGVITPTALVKNLAPIAQIVEYAYVKHNTPVKGIYDDFGELLPNLTASFTFTEHWWRLWVCAGVGIVLAIVGLLLYRKRDLECAGSTVAFRFLIPVFQIPCAIVVAAGSQFVCQSILYTESSLFLVLAVGLAVGWFIGKMLTNHTTRVFQLKNWVQLAGLAAVIAVTLLATKLDVFGIEEWQPKAEDIESVHFGSMYTADMPYTEPEDIEAVLELQRLAVEDRVESGGTYILENGQPVKPSLITRQEASEDAFYASNIHIIYTLKNGKTVERRYAVWSDQPEGDIARKLLSRWDMVTERTATVDGKEIEVLDLVLSDFNSIYFSQIDAEALEPYQNVEEAKSLIAAVQADCAAGTMAQDPYLHNGCFQYPTKERDSGYYQSKELYLRIRGGDYGWGVEVYPDCVNTLAWLQDRGLLKAEIMAENIFY